MIKTDNESLIPSHGGYRNLKGFQIAQLIYDVTVRFCDLYIDKRSRTHDQMVQAARSGVQNIAEGSQASGTSKKMELKLTNVARASLEELRLDYEDYLRQRELTILPSDHPVLMRFKKKRCATVEEVHLWVADELDKQSTNRHQPARSEEINLKSRPAVPVSESLSSSVLAANAALSLINLATYLLDRLLAAQARDFEKEGGFTERLYRVRSGKRPGPGHSNPIPPTSNR